MAKKHTTTGQTRSTIKTWITSQPSNQRRELRSALSTIRKAFNPREVRDLLWWHTVGTQVSKFFPDGDRQYGSSVMEMLARELGAADQKAINSVSNILWQARTVANTLGTKTAAKSWAKKRNSKDRPLSAYHVFAVAKLGPDDQRQYLERCLEEAWSVQRLRAEVQNAFGQKRSRGGRKAKPREVPSPVVALQEIQLAARQWLASHEVWYSAKKAALRRVPKRERTELFSRELEATIKAIELMNKVVHNELTRLESLAEEASPGE